jgi:hypothetical protein
MSEHFAHSLGYLGVDAASGVGGGVAGRRRRVAVVTRVVGIVLVWGEHVAGWTGPGQDGLESVITGWHLGIFRPSNRPRGCGCDRMAIVVAAGRSHA